LLEGGSTEGVFVIMNDMNDGKWVEVEVGDSRGYGPGTIVAVEKVHDWWIVVEPTGGNKYNFEAVCLCDIENYRHDIKKIPEDAETVVIGCDLCQVPLVRVKGFASKEWQMWIQESLLV
jgi:hypothetical protein